MVGCGTEDGKSLVALSASQRPGDHITSPTSASGISRCGSARCRTNMVRGGACRPGLTMVQIDPSTRRRIDPGEGGELGLG
jgi:hypothetical protein